MSRFVLAALAPLLSGCGVGHFLFGMGYSGDQSLGQPGQVPTVFGYAVADEPQAALVARQVLEQGGNAADAATAAGFALAVTLPSRAGLGGGGACVIKMPDAPAVTLVFPPGAPAAGGGTRPAAVPSLARGLLAMQAKYGVLAYSATIVPAERLAGGVPVSPALAADLQVVGAALLADPAAAAVFGAPSGRVLQAGADLVQPDLAASLETLRTQGVPGFYDGGFAEQFADAADASGAAITVDDLRGDVPVFGAPRSYASQGFDIAMLPTAAPGGAVLPASAGFAVVDKDGGAVACATTMNNLFGNGRVAAGTGILLAASPRVVPVPALAAGIASAGSKFRAAVTGTGQEGAAEAAVEAMEAALHRQPVDVPDPGRANVITCPGEVPGGEASCSASADGRGFGLAVGGR